MGKYIEDDIKYISFHLSLNSNVNNILNHIEERAVIILSCGLKFLFDGKDAIHEELKDLNRSQTKPEAHLSTNLRSMFSSKRNICTTNSPQIES